MPYSEELDRSGGRIHFELRFGTGCQDIHSVYSFEVGKGLNKTAEIIITIIINNIRRTEKMFPKHIWC